MRSKIWLALVVLLAVGLVVYYLPKLRSSNPSSSTAQKSIIDPNKILSGGPGKDGIPSIDHPKFASVEETSWLKDGDLLLLVSLNNQTKAYPILIMNWHEIVNDKIGDTPIVVTYCPLCGSGLTFKRIVEGKEVEFGVSGKLYNSDLLLYDRLTDSLWAQILGEAVQGEEAGKKLEMVDTNLVDYKTLKEKYPKALVLSKDTGFSRDYSRSPYRDYDRVSDIYFPVEHQSDALFAKDRVVGIEVDGKFKAYKFDALKQKREIKDSFASQEISITVDDKDQIAITDQDGNKITFINTFWFAWVAFHPETEIFK